MRKLFVAAMAIAVLAGVGYVASQYGLQALLHPAAFIPRSPIQNAHTAILEKDIAAGEAELKKRQAEFVPFEAANQARIEHDRQLQKEILANQHGFFSGPDPKLKRLYDEQAEVRREAQNARWRYNLAKFKVASKMKDLAELNIQLLSEQQGPGDVAIPDLKKMLAVRQAALKFYEVYVDVLANLESQVYLKWYATRDTVREGPRYIGQARYQQAKRDLTILEGPQKQFATSLENARKTLEKKRQEIAALKEAVMSPAERRNRDAMRAMVMQGIAQGMANLPDADYGQVLQRNFAVCRSGDLTASAPAPATIGAPCTITNGVETVHGTVSSY